MESNHVGKTTGIVGGLMVALSLAIFTVPLIAQNAAGSRPHYDVTREITIGGTVLGVLSRPAPDITWGFHLLIATVTGTVDASLGRWGLQSNVLSLIDGKQVEVLGVMNNVNGKQVFLARTVKVDGKTYVIRNAQGVPVSPQARERAAQK